MNARQGQTGLPVNSKDWMNLDDHDSLYVAWCSDSNRDAFSDESLRAFSRRHLHGWFVEREIAQIENYLAQSNCIENWKGRWNA